MRHRMAQTVCQSEVTTKNDDDFYKVFLLIPAVDQRIQLSDEKGVACKRVNERFKGTSN